MKKHNSSRRLLIAAVAMIAFGFLAPLAAIAAQPVAGKVYRLINGMYSTALTGNGPTASVTCSAVENNNYSQLWLVSAGSSANSFYLRNLNTGMYLSSSRNFSSPWTISLTPSDGNCAMAFDVKGDKYAIHYMSDIYQCLHCDSQGIAVCWTSDAEASQWTLTEVSMTQ